MMCPRKFQVEALRDGRLGGAERRSFERHVAACAVCARESAALENLAEAARAAFGEASNADDLHVWRERSRLLEAFDRTVVSSEGRPRSKGWLFWPAAVTALAAALVVFWRTRPVIEPESVRATIQADASAVWSRLPSTGDREKVALERGTLQIRIDHRAGERQVVVVLPDGELEDVGTIFRVSVEGKRTSRVEVEEGKVVLRLRGRPLAEIQAGQVWLPDAPAVAPPEMAPPPPRLETSEERGRPRQQPRPRPVNARQPHDVAPPDPLVEFRAASSALRAGNNRLAADAFTRFLADHADDPMAEDAAYLRVIAFQRIGVDEDVKRAARAYLDRFPSGFRHAEVARLGRQ
jgi:hypothetical protein